MAIDKNSVVKEEEDFYCGDTTTNQISHATSRYRLLVGILVEVK